MADTVRERLERRREEQLAKLEQRKSEKENTSQPNESADYFAATFKEEKQTIENMLSEASLAKCSGNKMKLIEYFDSLVDKCQRLQKFLSDSSIFLPSHVLKSGQSSISSLQQTINEKRDAYIPKKKFAFKTRKKAAAASDHTETDALSKAPDNSAADESSKLKEVGRFTEKICGFRGLRSENLKMTSIEITGKDVNLADLTDCTIKLYGALLTLHINKLQDCKIFCGPVSTSVFIDNCKNCTFVLASQQLRVHTTFDSSFYIHVTSNAIVEDCSRVGFAAFNWDYEELNKHFALAGLNNKENNWSMVKDFNWLKTDVQSPNWHIIPEDDQTVCWDN